MRNVNHKPNVINVGDMKIKRPKERRLVEVFYAEGSESFSGVPFFCLTGKKTAGWGYCDERWGGGMKLLERITYLIAK